MDSVKERLDAEAVPRCEEALLVRIPKRKREFAAEIVETRGPFFFVKVRQNFAVTA
jgi:hypothetical protein